MSDTAQDIVAAAAELAKGRVSSLFDDFYNRVESPIEGLFLAGIIYLAAERSYTLGEDSFVFQAAHHEFGERQSKAGVIDVWLQPRIGSYRADFVLDWLPSQEWQRDRRVTLVVECDGHDYHERTKEQARRDRSRDRDLQLAGHHVVRFTGSELHADALTCASDAFEILVNLAMR